MEFRNEITRKFRVSWFEMIMLFSMSPFSRNCFICFFKLSRFVYIDKKGQPTLSIRVFFSLEWNPSERFNSNMGKRKSKENKSNAKFDTNKSNIRIKLDKRFEIVTNNGWWQEITKFILSIFWLMNMEKVLFEIQWK